MKTIRDNLFLVSDSCVDCLSSDRLNSSTQRLAVTRVLTAVEELICMLDSVDKQCVMPRAFTQIPDTKD